ncbi:Glutathione transferase GST 23 [Morella rubra]|uniref:glutathione transferase n=1 Tax=Morella rubra TaxID=262757 RepID=A0A6A1W8Y9_9ROSI|nr:Glutathione transferase GST 23 [Morella rubra]
MGSQDVKLLGLWVSPFSRRVEWALKLKGVDYEYIEEDIFNKSSLLLELNPVHKKVPVLVHGPKTIAESYVILEYIDETWKQNPLLPQDPHERAKARFWARFAEEKLLEAAWNALCSLGDEKEKALKLAIEAAEKIEEEIKGKKFFSGERIGYLDIAMGWIAHWLPVWEEVGSMQILDPVNFPATKAWMKEFLNLPVIKDNLPPTEKMLLYCHERSKILSSNPRGWIRVA